MNLPTTARIELGKPSNKTPDLEMKTIEDEAEFKQLDERERKTIASHVLRAYIRDGLDLPKEKTINRYANSTWLNKDRSVEYKLGKEFVAHSIAQVEAHLLHKYQESVRSVGVNLQANDQINYFAAKFWTKMGKKFAHRFVRDQTVRMYLALDINANGKRKGVKALAERMGISTTTVRQWYKKAEATDSSHA